MLISQNGGYNNRKNCFQLVTIFLFNYRYKKSYILQNIIWNGISREWGTFKVNIKEVMEKNLIFFKRTEKTSFLSHLDFNVFIPQSHRGPKSTSFSSSNLWRDYPKTLALTLDKPRKEPTNCSVFKSWMITILSNDSAISQF